MRLIILFFYLSLVMVANVHAQTGCTDPQATNYNPDASVNDGSCVYPATGMTVLPKTTLAAALGESSGLLVANGLIWTINDSGGTPEIFQVDSLTGAVVKTVTLGGATNVDWEDIAFDGTNVYVGDFGNNANGNRTDLKIYKFSLAAVPAGSVVEVPAIDVETISFAYEDQTDFTPQGPNNTRFDTEAMFYWNNQLHLFTKDWLDKNTAHYLLPTTAGAYTATKKETFFANGLITGADISAKGVIILLGYRLNTAEAFTWLLFDYPGIEFFSGNKREIGLGPITSVGQVEGIGFRDTGAGFISNEKVLSLIPARLYGFDVFPWLPADLLPAKEPLKKNESSCDHPVNPVTLPQLQEWGRRLPAGAAFVLWDTAARQVLTSGTPMTAGVAITPGIYRLQWTTTSPARQCATSLMIK